MFAKFFVSKIDSLKSAIASQLIHIAPPPPDHVCSYPSLHLLEPVTSLEVSKLLSIIPPKSCYLDYIPTANTKQCSSVFSDTNLRHKEFRKHTERNIVINTLQIYPSLRALFPPSFNTPLLLRF